MCTNFYKDSGVDAAITHVVQLLSCVQLFVIAWTAARQAPLSSLSPGVWLLCPHYLLEFAHIHVR